MKELEKVIINDIGKSQMQCADGNHLYIKTGRDDMYAIYHCKHEGCEKIWLQDIEDYYEALREEERADEEDDYDMDELY